MKDEFPQSFALNHESLIKRLKPRGKQPKTKEELALKTYFRLIPISFA